MNSRAVQWIGIAMLLPVLAAAQESSVTRAAEPADESAPKLSRAAVDLQSPAVQAMLRRTTEAATADADAAATVAEPGETRARKLEGLRFHAPRRVHHLECEAFDCVAYAADGSSLYTISRDHVGGQNVFTHAHDQDGWLSCQGADDLLSTFERFDKCRGLTIGLPLHRLQDVEIRLPERL
jgi:hypothetical protein